MAKLTTTGLSDFVLSMEELRNMPKGVIEDMLEAASVPVIEAQKAQFREDGLVKTGTLADSPGWNGSVYNAGEGRYIDVYPQGTNHTRTAKSDSAKDTKRRHKKKKGSESDITNAEVAFIHEFGAKGRNITATQSIRVATEKSADEAAEEKQRVYDEYVSSLGL